VKGISKARLVLALLAVLILVLVPATAWAQTTIDSSCTTFQWSSDRHVFYAQDRHWVFWGSTTVYYRSSPDNGDTWSDRASLTGSSDFAVTTDGTYVHFAWYSSGSGIKYKRGTLNADGSISWGSDQAVVEAQNVRDIAVDSEGYPWIGYRYVYSQPSYAAYTYARVTKSSTKDGTWTTAPDFPYTLASYGFYGTGATTAVVNLTPHTSEAMLVIYRVGTTSTYVKRWAAGWSSAKTLGAVSHPGGLTDKQYVSAVAQDDDTHIVFLESTTNDICYREYSTTTHSLSTKLVLYDGDSSVSAPVITRVTDNDDLYVWWKNSPAANHIYYATYESASDTWYSYTDWLTDLNGLPSTKYTIASMAAVDRDYLGLVYLANGNLLRWKFLPEEWDVVTLDPSSITSSQATLRGEIVTVGSGATGSFAGFYYGTTSPPTNPIGTIGTFGPGVFTETISGLQADSIYYYYAVVEDEFSNSYTGNITSFMTDADYTSPWAPGGEDTLITVPTPPPGWHRPSPSTGAIEGTLIGGLLNPFFESSGFPVEFVWWVIFAILCNLVCILSFALGRHTFMVFVAGSLVIGSMCALGIIDWWLIFVYIVFGLSLLVNERQIAV